MLMLTMAGLIFAMMRAMTRRCKEREGEFQNSQTMRQDADQESIELEIDPERF